MSTKDKDPLLELNLLENGIDFILRGIDELFDESYKLTGYSRPLEVTQWSYKYGTLHLFSGFLLLLKERLSRHLPELLFSGRISEIKEKLGAGKRLKTVNLDEVLERLEIGPKVLFSDEEMKMIRAMQNYRNEFEHYKVSVNKYQLWNTVTDFLNLIDKFLDKELQINIEMTTDSLELGRKIDQIESVWNRHKKRVERELRERMNYLLEDLRERRDEIQEELDSEYRLNKGSIITYIECPECGEEKLIVHGDYSGLCSNPECENYFLIVNCDRCDQPIAGDLWDMNLCESCELFYEQE